MLIQDYAALPPGVETPGYRLKPVKTGSRDVAVLGVEDLCKRSIWIPSELHRLIAKVQNPAVTTGLIALKRSL
jgi:hypothetical protein